MSHVNFRKWQWPLLLDRVPVPVIPIQGWMLLQCKKKKKKKKKEREKKKGGGGSILKFEAPKL